MDIPIHDDPELWACAAATGGLTPSALAQWHEHLATCPACKRINTEELAMRDLLKKTFDQESPDSGFEQRIIQRLRQGPLREKTPWHAFLGSHLFLYGAATAALLAAALVVVQWPHRPAPAVTGGSAANILAGLPEHARAAIQARAGGKVISRIDQDDDNGEISFIVTVASPAGGPSHFTIGSDGGLISVDRSLAEIPQAVRQAVSAQSAGARVEEVQETFEDAQPAYVATMAFPDGRERDYTFGRDGSLTEIETSLAELSAAVQDSIKTHVGKGTMESIDKVFDSGEIDYVVTMSGADALQRDYTFDETGALLSVEAFQGELPPAVLSAVKSAVGRGTLEGIDKTFEDGGVTYEATMTTPDGSERDFSVSSTGQIASEEVALDETPPAVQRTISQTLGPGKLVEVSESFDEPGGKVPYEIEASVNGRPLYFLVSRAGDFLGTED